MSVRDAGRYCDTKVNLAVKDGYGRLFEKLSQDLAIRFMSPVDAIETRGNGVRVSGSFGEIDCAAAICSPRRSGALAAGAITLRPAPPGLCGALDDIRMGTYEKTVIAFDRPILQFPAGNRELLLRHRRPCRCR